MIICHKKYCNNLSKKNLDIIAIPKKLLNIGKVIETNAFVIRYRINKTVVRYRKGKHKS